MHPWRHNSSNVGRVIAGQARHNSSNVGGVTAGQVGHNSSNLNDGNQSLHPGSQPTVTNLLQAHDFVLWDFVMWDYVWITVSRIEFTVKSSVYWPIIGLGTRT